MSRKTRRTWRWVALIAVLLIAAGTGGYPVYVHPRTDELRPADAIFVLGGYGQDRAKFGASLYRQGWAPNLVISNPGGDAVPPRGPAAQWFATWCKSPTYGSDVLGRQPVSTKFCPDPRPPTTEGEAAAFSRIAAEKHWHSVIVVTFRPHISRARAIFGRCFDGDVIMAEVPVEISTARWIYEYLYQSAGFIKFVFEHNC